MKYPQRCNCDGKRVTNKNKVCVAGIAPDPPGRIYAVGFDDNKGLFMFLLWYWSQFKALSRHALKRVYDPYLHTKTHKKTRNN